MNNLALSNSAFGNPVIDRQHDDDRGVVQVARERLLAFMHYRGHHDTEVDVPSIGKNQNAAFRPAYVYYSSIHDDTFAWEANQDVIDSFMEIMLLEDGWDGYDGIATKPECANAAFNVYEFLLRCGVSKPSITPVNDGTAMLEWHWSNHIVELHFLDGTAIMATCRDLEHGVDGIEKFEGSLRDLPKVIKWLLDIKKIYQAK